MTSQRSLLTVERSLYLAFFALALALRLYQLNAHPLTDAEAREALLAYRLIRGTVDSSAALPHSPAYFFFTYFSFLLFDASNATARLAPALFGAMILLTATRSVPVIGVAAFSSALIVGQLVSSVVLDQMGAFGHASHPLDAGRVLGIAFLLVGLRLVLR